MKKRTRSQNIVRVGTQTFNALGLIDGARALVGVKMAVKHKIDVIFVENLLKLIAEVLEMNVSQLKRMASFGFSAQTSAMISDFSSRSLKGEHVKNIRAGRHI